MITLDAVEKAFGDESLAEIVEIAKYLTINGTGEIIITEPSTDLQTKLKSLGICPFANTKTRTETVKVNA